MKSLNLSASIDSLIFQWVTFGGSWLMIIDDWLCSAFLVLAPFSFQFLEGIFLIAQSSMGGKLEESLEKGLKIISLFAFIIATIVIMYGGYQIRTGNADAGKMSILGGLIIGLAVVIVTSIFDIAGLPVLKISR